MSDTQATPKLYEIRPGHHPVWTEWEMWSVFTADGWYSFYSPRAAERFADLCRGGMNPVEAKRLVQYES